MANVLTRVGWKKEFVDKSVPFLPISGWKGDNLITQSTNMTWWKGVDIEVPGKGKKLITTLLDALEEMVVPPERLPNKPMRTPISGVYKIKGAGDVLTGRVEQGVVKPGDEVIFLPTHTANLACNGKIFSVEMHHKSQPAANAGDNVGLNIKGLAKENMPRVGDIMILKSDQTLKKAREFTCQVQILNHPGELKVGYSPIAFVRTARSAVRMSKINWKISKETGNKKAPEPTNIKANEMAEVVFQPQQPFVVDSFKNCEGLGRIAIMEGATVVMLGKVIETIADDGKPVEDPKAKGAAAPAKGGAAAAPAKGGAAAAKPAAKPPAKK
jgi:elongation factor 1-alpha